MKNKNNKVYKDDDGELHRVNGPAIEWSDGDYSWYHHGEWHRYYGVQSTDNNYIIFGKLVK